MEITEKMEEYRKNLRQQLIEAHAKVDYTYTAHHKIEDRVRLFDKSLRIIQIVLTAISTGGFLATVITSQTFLCWIGGISAALSLGLNLYTKDFKLQADAREHKDAADALWSIREDYVSLLIDMDVLPVEEICRRRDHLKEALFEIYKRYPGTDRKGYEEARRALNDEDEQTFQVGEAEKLLPTVLREKK